MESLKPRAHEFFIPFMQTIAGKKLKYKDETDFLKSLKVNPLDFMEALSDY